MKKLTIEEAVAQCAPALIALHASKKAERAGLLEQSYAKAKAEALSLPAAMQDAIMPKLEETHKQRVEALDDPLSQEDAERFLTENLEDLFGEAAGSLSFAVLTEAFGRYYTWSDRIEGLPTLTDEERAHADRAYDAAVALHLALAPLVTDKDAEGAAMGTAYALSELLQYRRFLGEHP